MGAAGSSDEVGPPARFRAGPGSGFDVYDEVWTSGRRVPRWAAMSGLTGLVLVIAAGLIVHAGRGIVFTPEQAAADFFAALQAKDTSLRIDGARVDLIGGGYEAPGEVVVEQTRSVSADAAIVAVSYLVGGERWGVEVPVSRTRYWGPWTVAAPSTELELVWPRGSEGLEATVDGAAVGSGSRLLPGVYTLGIADHETLEAAEPFRLVVSGTEAGVTVAPPVQPRTELQPRLTQLITSYLDDCVVAAPDDSTVVAGCPLRVSGLGLPFPEDVMWEITAYPVVSLAIGELEPLEVVTSTPGTATVSYLQGDDREEAAVPIEIGGWAGLEDGRLVWHRNNLDVVTE